MNDIFKMAQQAYHALSIAESELKRLYKENAELRQALAQPVDAVNTSQERVDETAKREHEPVAFVTIEAALDGDWRKCPSIKWFNNPTEGPLYTAPSKREWVGLTDDERSYYLQAAANVGWWQASLFIEAQLKEKNT